MPSPVDTPADWLVTRADEIELVTVESLDPDAEDGSDVLATATDVRALAGREIGGETAAGGGTVGRTRRNFTLVTGDMAFALKNRDRITRTDGTKWLTGDTDAGGFGGLAIARDCVKQTG